ncbi:MAG: Asp-tRNA(Asn)/Glu-tRNA(Gln) amidotransferase subunit GatA, partial [Phycisphaeraceae bacterium]
EQVVRGYLDRIEKYDGELNSYHEVFTDRALERARQVDAGQVTGPLAGVPVALKDVLCTDHGHTTCSSRMLESFQAPYTATAVQRLEDAGAIILGKTNMDEFAMGSSCEHCAFGPVGNPWHKQAVPGGSSGGSAAAMAADLCAAAIGTDTGGSIRQPAAFSGVVGLKPTYGRVSRYGLVAFASSLDQAGPITRTIDDAALLLHAMAGHDALDSTSANVPVPDDLTQLDAPLDGLRIGIARQYVSDSNDAAVNDAVSQAQNIFRDHGAELVEVDLPHTGYGISVYYILATAECSSNLARYDGVHYGHRTDNPRDLMELVARSRSEGFGDEVKRRIMLGTYALSTGYYDAYYLRALKVRRLIKQDFDRAFENCDAILCPTSPTLPFKRGDRLDDPLKMYMADVYTVPSSLAGISAVSLPGGFIDESDGALPIGVQLLGGAFEETRLLRIARLYEQAAGHHQRRPRL